MKGSEKSMKGSEELRDRQWEAKQRPMKSSADIARKGSGEAAFHPD